MSEKKNLFEKIIVKPLNKFANFRVIRSISSGFQSSVGVLMIGAFLSIISVILGFIPGIAESAFVVKFNVLKDLVFGLTGILFTYAIAAADAKITKTDEKSAGFMAIVVFFIFMKPTLAVDENYVTTFVAPFARFGLQSMLVSMVAGIWAAEIAALFRKQKWMLNSDGLPEIAKTWFEYLFAGTFIVLSAWAVSYLLDFDLHTIFNTLLAPLLGIFSSFWGWVLISVIGTVAFFFGIHAASVTSLVSPIYYIALMQNIELLNSGLDPTVENGFIIINMGFMLFMSVFGGAGATLGLNIDMLFSKNKSIKKLGRMALFPSLININEPLIFGLPIFYNSVFLVPFIGGLIINSALAYGVFYLGWVNIPSTLALLQFMPAPFGAYLLTNDFRAIILAVVIILLDMVIWWPFLKMHEKNLAAAEAKENLAEEAEAAA
jgi:PTS system cellobiose-specific IIC component